MRLGAMAWVLMAVGCRATATLSADDVVWVRALDVTLTEADQGEVRAVLESPTADVTRITWSLTLDGLQIAKGLEGQPKPTGWPPLIQLTAPLDVRTLGFRPGQTYSEATLKGTLTFGPTRGEREAVFAKRLEVLLDGLPVRRVTP